VTTLSSLKSVEDRLDALICAWIGIEHLDGRTVGLGDATAAIWVPAKLME
jgi:predicted RNase H-like nuclease